MGATQAEGEAGSMQGALCGTRSQDARITRWAEGRCQTAKPPRDPLYFFNRSIHFKSSEMGDPKKDGINQGEPMKKEEGKGQRTVHSGGSQAGTESGDDHQSQPLLKRHLSLGIPKKEPEHGFRFR